MKKAVSQEEHRREGLSPEPRHLSIKEIAAYGIGGFGVKTVTSLAGYFSFTVSAIIIADVYAIRPTDIAMVAFIIGVLQLLRIPFFSKLLDNTKSNRGKFRPYLLTAGIPSALLLAVIPLVPVDAPYWLRLSLLGGASILLTQFQALYDYAYTLQGQVLTPNGKERTTLFSVSNFFGLFVPVILGFCLARLNSSETDKILFVRIVFPLVALIGVLLSLIGFFFTKERLIVPQNHRFSVRFGEGIRLICGNHFFWLLVLYQVLSVLKNVTGILSAWNSMLMLQQADNLYQTVNNNAVIAIVFAAAFFVAILFFPMLANKVGKRNLLIGTNLLYALCCVLALVLKQSPLIVYLLLAVSSLMLATDGVVLLSMTADVYDYQQWKSGKRLEGFISQFIGFFVLITTAVSGQLLANLNSPSTSVEAQLFSDTAPAVEAPTLSVVIGVISSLACLVPLFFYTLNERRHAAIIQDLRDRAAAEDAALEESAAQPE